MTTLHKLNNLGQSVWLDYIRRSFIEDGGLQNVIDQGVRGVTSNPSIFEKAINGSDDYDDDLQALVKAGHTVDEIYETLAIADIRQAADLFHPLYQESDGLDGYVSLEVSPSLARDTDGTIAEAKRLYETVGRPNVMIKIPATPAGIPAIEETLANGINVNVTLLFSVSQYKPVVEAYLTGLERYQAAGGDLGRIASVASFFVSRVDGKVDAALEEKDNTALQGKIAIDNAKMARRYFEEAFNSKRWQTLSQAGAKVQRLLWASTSVKNPAYPDTLYVDNLIGPETVNTMPLDTLEATLDHGATAHTLETDLDTSRARLQQLADLGLSLAQITETLQDEGVDSFAESFKTLLGSIENKCSDLGTPCPSRATAASVDSFAAG